MKRPRGTGSVYLRKGSQNYMLHYYRNGVDTREASGTSDKRQAEKLLQRRLGEIAVGQFIDPADRRLTIDELYEAYLDYYRANKKASLQGAEQRWQRQPKEGQPMPPPGRLKKAFSGMKALALTTDKLNKYAISCQKQGLADATINRDFSALRKAFNLAHDAEKLSRVPHFPMLKEAPPRKGFIEYEDYLKLIKHASELWLRTLLTLAYVGVRRGELIGDKRNDYQDAMRVRHVDLRARNIRLIETKNGDDRIVPMTRELFHLMTALVSGKGKDEFVFTRENGEQVRDFRDRWEKLLREASVEDKLVHDTRRSGARNLRRAGVDEGTIMRWGGWKTRSVFERYNIVNERDLAEAADKYDAATRIWTERLQNGYSQDNLHQNRAPVDFQKVALKPSKSVN